ncbi:MAG: penicillin-binding protein 2 [Oscillospiraceae bacterium]
MWKRMAVVLSCLMVGFSLLYMRIMYISQDEKLAKTALNQGSYTISVAKTYGNIYDCNFKLLNNNNYKIMAVINPTIDNIKQILPLVSDLKSFYKQVQNGKPFVTELKSQPENSEILTFNIPIRASENQLAPHIIGYTSENMGVCGIEKAYDKFLRSSVNQLTVSYNVDGKGKVLYGKGKSFEPEKPMKSGVVTTLDLEIQKIAEQAAKLMEKGAIIVPTFTPVSVEKFLDDENSPMINRAFSAYNVGSIFKLVTAATALEEGISPNLAYDCKGIIDIDGQNFKCHKLDGHSVLDMKGAMAESCNTYFIDLSKQISSADFISKAAILGFGRENYLADGIISASGNLQTTSQLYNPAEKANLAFGQGMLTATPLQVASMTAAIVNGGKLTEPRLVLGTTSDGWSIPNSGETVYTNAINPTTAAILRNFLINDIINPSTAAARPENVSAAGKTSTAQTGRFDENGVEYSEAWFTGYFPANEPKYVVTVLVENGKSGNSSAGPIFKEIAEKVTELDNSRYELRE